MNQTTLAWAALKNMLRMAGRDPIWAITSLCVAPFRAIKPVLQGFALICIVMIGIGLAGVLILQAVGLERTIVGNLFMSALFLVVIGTLLFRLITNPLIVHFGDVADDTHGSARFATNKGSEQDLFPQTR